MARKKTIDAPTPAAFQILLALADGEKHGYQIMLEVKQNSSLHLGPATLYTTLKRLLDVGWIIESDIRPDSDLDDERRRYYALSNVGLKILKSEVDRLKNLLQQANRKLDWRKV